MDVRFDVGGNSRSSCPLSVIFHDRESRWSVKLFLLFYGTAVLQMQF